jgi:hypothetical protein
MYIYIRIYVYTYIHIYIYLYLYRMCSSGVLCAECGALRLTSYAYNLAFGSVAVLVM